MENEPALELEIRRKIYNCILKSPGIHYREISDRLHIPSSTMDYHLYYLKKRNLINSLQEKGYTRFYVTGKISTQDKIIFSVLRQKATRRIILFLLENPDSDHKKIRNHLNLAPSTTSFHLLKLIKYKIVERKFKGKDVSYNIINPENIIDILITYKKSFLDDSIDSVIETWLNIHPRNQRK